MNYNGSGTSVTASAIAGYRFVNWSDGSTANPRTDTAVRANVAVTANFAPNVFTVTASAGPNGSISPNTPQSVAQGRVDDVHDHSQPGVPRRRRHGQRGLEGRAGELHRHECDRRARRHGELRGQRGRAAPPTVYQYVFRFRNLKLGNHLLTADTTSLSAAQAKLYINEGVAYNVNVATNRDTVYRFQNKKGGFYIYTADPVEVANIRSNLSKTWTYQGPVFTVSRSGGAPVWRFRNKKGGFYLYTADPVEAAGIPKTWVKEGISYYIAP